MKRFFVALFCTVVLVGVVPSLGAAAAEPCEPTEAESQMMYGSVFRLGEAGVVKLRIDWVDGILSPVTRASFASMVVRVMGQPDPEVFAAVRPFADVEGHWAAGAIAAVLAEGIVTGDPSGRFRPDEYITLNEAKLMLARMLRLGPDLSLSNADKALRRGGVDTALPCAQAERVTYLQAYTLLDRALAVPYYARLQWSELRIRREFAAGVLYESEDGTRIEAPTWAQIEAELARVRGGANSYASLTVRDRSYIKVVGGPDWFLVDVRIYLPDGTFKHYRAGGTTYAGAVPPLFRSFMEEEFLAAGTEWIDITDTFTGR